MATFSSSDGGALATLGSRQAIASVLTDINSIVLGSGPLGPQPLDLSDGGALAILGHNSAIPYVPGHFILHGGGATTGVGFLFAALTIPPATLSLDQPELFFGPGPASIPAGLMITLGDDSLDTSPGTLIAFVSNGTPDGPVHLTVTGSGEVLYTTFDDTGALGGISIPVHTASTGAHQLVATDETTAFTATATFTVLTINTAVTIGVPVTTPPTNVQQSLGVRKWVFQDPATNEVYHFPINPNAMNTPFAPKKIVFAATTAIDGARLAFEGQPEPVQWQFEGSLITQGQYEAFQYWLTKRNRIWVTDHRNRAWLVYLTSYAPVDRRATNHAWSHTYTITALIFEGPVTPT